MKKKMFLYAALCAGLSVCSVQAQTMGSGKFNKVHTLYGYGNKTPASLKNPAALQQLEAFIGESIAKGAFPGCQVFAAKDGEVLMMKSFGHFDFNRKNAVTDTSMYDVASVTKIVSTTLAVMKLYDEKKLNIYAPLSLYLDIVKGTDKANITVEQLLLHQAGFKAWIPFHRQTLDSLTGTLRKDLFSSTAVPGYNIPVAASLFIKDSYPNYILNEMVNSPLVNKGKYVYSDIDLVLLQKIVEKITGMRLDRYVYDNFYEPLKLRRTMYNPWILGYTANCAPTENDMEYRMQHLQGYVHDPVASLLGGMAGHAGIFSTAREIGQIMQMLLNGGEYNGVRYIKKETVAMFTSYKSRISRRGYGFDKPEKKGDSGPTADICSKATFGHTGFTGTCAWADPETGIVFVFLSNRVNPTAANGLITSLKVRGKVQTYIYEAAGYGRK